MRSWIGTIWNYMQSSLTFIFCAILLLVRCNMHFKAWYKLWNVYYVLVTKLCKWKCDVGPGVWNMKINSRPRKVKSCCSTLPFPSVRWSLRKEQKDFQLVVHHLLIIKMLLTISSLAILATTTFACGPLSGATGGTSFCATQLCRSIVTWGLNQNFQSPPDPWYSILASPTLSHEVKWRVKV